MSKQFNPIEFELSLPQENSGDLVILFVLDLSLDSVIIFSVRLQQANRDKINKPC